MLKFPNFLIALTLVASPSFADTLGLGRVALPEEIAAWDLDVSPDGTGLPVGSGNVLVGEEVFADKCASCHGDFAEGVDNWPKLAGGAGTLDHEDPLKTVGSYWPYLSTTWDYVNRSMPFGDAQSLSPDEVYAIVAYIIYSNDWWTKILYCRMRHLPILNCQTKMVSSSMTVWKQSIQNGSASRAWKTVKKMSK